MSTQRKRYSAEFKARVALEALKGHKTGQRVSGSIGGASDPDYPWETSPATGGA